MTPEGWKEHHLADVCTRITDGSHFSPTPVDVGIPIATVANMSTNGIDVNRCARVSEEDFLSLERNGCRPRSGDVLFSKDGSIGKVLVIRDDPQLVLLSSIAILTPRQNELDSAFLSQSLRWTENLRKLHGMRTGTAIKRIVLRDLRRLQLAVPPLPEQRKIATILSSVDDAIEKTQAVIDQVQIVKRGLMQELLTRGLPGRHTRFKQTEIGEIPEGWDVLPLANFVEKGPDNGLYRPQRDYGAGTPIVRIDAFDNGDRLQRLELKRVYLEPEAVERFMVKPGDILVNRVNSLSHLAKCALVLSVDEPTVYESNIMRLSLDNTRLTTEFGFRWLSSEYVKANLRGKAKKAIAQASVNQNDVLTIPTPLPSLAEQQHIAGTIGEVERRIDSEHDSLSGLLNVKAALMSALLTGEVRVTPGLKSA